MIDIQEIQEILEPLVGMPIWDSARAYTMQMFQIGERLTLPRPYPDRPGETRTVGTYALHVQCMWRIVGPEGIFVTCRDRFFPPGELIPDAIPENFNWEESKSNRCDERSNILFSLHENSPLVILKIHVDDAGGFRLTLSHGYSLDVIPLVSTGFNEHWRLFSPGAETPHRVLVGNKLRR